MCHYDDVTPSDTSCNNIVELSGFSAHEAKTTANTRKLQYKKVLDVRKRPIRGLWVRHGRYYARIAIEDAKTGKARSRRVPLEGVGSAPQALAELNRLRQLKRDNALPILQRTPKFSDYVQENPAYSSVLTGKPRTVKCGGSISTISWPPS